MLDIRQIAARAQGAVWAEINQNRLPALTAVDLTNTYTSTVGITLSAAIADAAFIAASTNADHVKNFVRDAVSLGIAKALSEIVAAFEDELKKQSMQKRVSGLLILRDGANQFRVHQVLMHDNSGNFLVASSEDLVAIVQRELAAEVGATLNQV